MSLIVPINSRRSDMQWAVPGAVAVAGVAVADAIAHPSPLPPHSPLQTHGRPPPHLPDARRHAPAGDGGAAGHRGGPHGGAWGQLAGAGGEETAGLMLHELRRVLEALDDCLAQAPAPSAAAAAAATSASASAAAPTSGVAAPAGGGGGGAGVGAAGAGGSGGSAGGGWERLRGLEEQVARLTAVAIRVAPERLALRGLEQAAASARPGGSGDWREAATAMVRTYVVRSPWCKVALSLSLSLSHTHTHTHTLSLSVSLSLSLSLSVSL